MKVKATANLKTGETHEIEIDYDFGNDLSHMVSLFGEEVVYHHARANMVISVQGALRAWMKQDFSDEQIYKSLRDWQMPHKKSRGLPALDKIKRQLERLSDADREALLSQLRD